MLKFSHSLRLARFGASSKLMTKPFSSENKNTTVAEDGMDRGLQHCIDLVKQNDHENFLCTLLLSDGERRDAFALRALNVEVAKCKENSDENLRQLKLRFWCDAIDQCFSNEPSFVQDHPVLRELQKAIHKHKLSKRYLKKLVRARERPSNQPFETLNEMERYAEDAFSSIFSLLVQCKSVKDLHVDHATSHVGKAQGLTTLLRAIPHKRPGDVLNIPKELMDKYDVDEERIMRHESGDKQVEDCIYHVAATAADHLSRARRMQDNIPDNARKIFLPAVAVDRYLERLRKANFKLTDKSVMQRDNLLPMSLYWYGVRGRY